MPVIGAAYVEGRFPRELIPGMAELGLLGANLPEEFGCAGLNNVAYGLIMQELERGDSGIRSFASVQGGLVMYPIFAFGSEAQKRHWLPRLASGEEIGCFGLTEPDYGSNPAGMITTARETQGRLGPQRRQDVDHQRIPGYGGDHLGQDRCPGRSEVGARVHRPDSHEGILGEGPEGQAVAPRLGHLANSCWPTSTCPRMRSCPARAASRAPSCA